MANAYNANGTWILDSANAAAVTTEQLRVKGVRWVSESASAGDQVVLKDAAGKVVWESRATASHYVESDTIYGRPGMNWSGLIVATLTSGAVYLELL